MSEGVSLFLGVEVSCPLGGFVLGKEGIDAFSLTLSLPLGTMTEPDGVPKDDLSVYENST